MEKKLHHRAYASRTLSLGLASLMSFSSFAGTIRFDQGGLNARSSLNFVGHANVLRNESKGLTTVPKGTTGEVLERWQLPSGNTGVKIRITNLGSSATSLKTDQEIWVYFHQDPERRRVALLDDEGKQVEKADEGKWAIALSTFRVERPNTITPPCTDCSSEVAGSIPQAPLAGPTALLETAGQIVDLVAEEASDAPIVDTAYEEALTYIDRITHAYVKSSYELMIKRSISKAEFNMFQAEQKAKNPEIARALIDACAEYKVPVELALALMQQESQFVISAKSYVGARGLMQLMPKTYDELSNKAGRSKIADPALNTRLGVKYLAQQLRTFKGDQELALAAYNSGAGTVNNYLAGERKSLPKQSRDLIAKVGIYKTAYVAYVDKSRTTLVASNP